MLSITPPRWQANSRVLLNNLKPNPVTGLVEPSTAADTYIATQIEIIGDYGVAGQVAQELGWLSDPQLIQLYNSNIKNGSIDYPKWIAQLLMKGTSAHVLKGSNVMEISYTSSNPQSASAIANAIRSAYISQALIEKTKEASKNVSFFDAEVMKAVQRLDAATLAEDNYERESGLVLQNETSDVDSTQLRYLAGQGFESAAPANTGGDFSTETKIAQLDGAIAGAQNSLGPNNPDLRDLLTRRASIAEFAKKHTPPAQKEYANEEALRPRIEIQKTKVLAENKKLFKLQQLHEEVLLWQDQLNKSRAKAAEMRQQSAVVDTGIISLGQAVQATKPSFPNKPLVYIGATVLGFILGCLAAVLTELLARRVRGAEDLIEFSNIPLLACVRAPKWRPFRSDQAF